MKKIILIITGVVFVAAAAQAQSPRVEVSIADRGFRGLAAKPTRVTPKPNASQKAFDKRIGAAVMRAQAQTQRAAAPQAQAKAQKAATTQPSKKKGSVGQWLKAIFLGGKFPGESTEDYHHRLVVQSYPASQPFK